MYSPRISMIAAMDRNRGIGLNDRIPWHIKEDLQRFKKLTSGKTIIIGRKTFESLLGYYQKSGRPMPDRRTIVVSRRPEEAKKYTNSRNVFFTDSIESALEKARDVEPVEVLISGGAQIFGQGIKYAELLHLTLVDGEFEADTHFPEYSQFTRVIKSEKRHSDGFNFEFVDLEK